MNYSRPLLLLIAGSAALLLCPAARADSIPTLNATSASLSGGSSGIFWSIEGSSFSLAGSALPNVTLGSAMPGQSLADADFGGRGRFPFATMRGGSDDNTYGTVTLGGVEHAVELLGIVYLSFPRNDIYNPVISPPPADDSQAASSRVFSGPATVSGENFNGSQPIPLQELFCPPLEHPYCAGNVIASVNIDVPGIATLGGVNYAYNDPYDNITRIDFTTTPEPANAGLTAAGMVAVLGFMAFFRRRWQCRSSQASGVTRQLPSITPCRRSRNKTLASRPQRAAKKLAKGFSLTPALGYFHLQERSAPPRAVHTLGRFTKFR